MLKETINNDIKKAMKEKDALRLSTLRMVKADIMKHELSGRDQHADDEVVIQLIQKGVKQRKESAEGFKKGGNIPAAEKEEAEIEILKTYLPEAMSEEELTKITQGVIDQLNAQSSDFGKVMGIVMGKVKGRAEGNMVNATVKRLLG